MLSAGRFRFEIRGVAAISAVLYVAEIIEVLLGGAALQ